MPTEEEIEAAMYEIAGVFGGDEIGYDRTRKAAKAALEAAERVRGRPQPFELDADELAEIDRLSFIEDGEIEATPPPPPVDTDEYRS
jgi:hypothetical protein